MLNAESLGTPRKRILKREKESKNAACWVDESNLTLECKWNSAAVAEYGQLREQETKCKYTEEASISGLSRPFASSLTQHNQQESPSPIRIILYILYIWKKEKQEMNMWKAAGLLTL